MVHPKLIPAENETEKDTNELTPLVFPFEAIPGLRDDVFPRDGGIDGHLPGSPLPH